MARGRKTSFTLRLTPAERLTLLTWQRAATISAGRARRGRIILLVADGVPITDVAARVGLSRRHVYKWLQRFVHEGLQGLADRPGRGRRSGRRQLLESPTFTPREQEVLTLLATGQPTRRIAEALRLSPKTVETHILHLRQKLGLAHTSELIVYACWHAIYGSPALEAKRQPPA
jgi:DNA-binding CsgD family transcriptional regulator